MANNKKRGIAVVLEGKGSGFDSTLGFHIVAVFFSERYGFTAAQLARRWCNERIGISAIDRGWAKILVGRAARKLLANCSDI